MLGQTATLQGAQEQPRGASGGQGVCTVFCYCLCPRQAGRSASLWCGVKGAMVLYTVPAPAVSSRACLASTCPRVPSLSASGVRPPGVLGPYMEGLVVGRGSSRTLLLRSWPWGGCCSPCPAPAAGHYHHSPVAQPLWLLTFISRDQFHFCSLGLRQGKPLTRG